MSDDPTTPDALARFSPATRSWFTGAFHAPTPAQEQAWDAISAGEHTLVVAPTGSGKTLSAFLWALDRLATTPPPEDPKARCRVLYVSPLKALAVDVERNLRSPLVGIAREAQRLGEPAPQVSVATRSGDTPQSERRAFLTRPSDILITTPESLFLMLTSKARESLVGIETVILDEVHAVAGTKRGAHLALTLARLDAMLDRPTQRIGLSATVRPVEEVARFLTGGAPARIVAPPARKEWDLQVVVPVPDLSDLASASPDPEQFAPPPTFDPDGEPSLGPEPRASIWPHVEERIVDLVAAHTSTLVFANSRRLAERLTSRLNEIWQNRLEAAAAQDEGDGGAQAPPAAASRQQPPGPTIVRMTGTTTSGAPPVLARAHHGSVSKEGRAAIEDDLKSGRLPAVVATSSLELGIDMGAVDLVVQVESPPSVASGLQRVGRAGHQVGAVSRGVVFPKHRNDLVSSAVVVEQMRSGGIESLSVPANPLDVLAQQVVAMCALDDWKVDDLLRVVRTSAPFGALSRDMLTSVLDLLTGRYPAEEFASLRPRLVWDRMTDVLTGRPGAQRLAVTSGGTIPDRGLFGVFLASGEGPGRRVGELDEEMVYESRVGDVFTLGTSSWRIEQITHDRVLVTPAPGMPGRLPFWKGDTPGRPYELGVAVGAFLREVASLPEEAARERAAAAGLDEWACDNLLAYLAEQRESTGVVPDDRTIVVERFRDELGDWRVVVHSPFGGRVHAPWALAVAARLRERHGVDVQAMHGDDGIVMRLPDVEIDAWDVMGAGEPDGAEGTAGAGGADPAGASGASAGALREAVADLVEAVVIPPEDVQGIVTDEIGGSALFASRFRECAARALLLPRRNPGKRQALWQQRQRSAQLLAVASRYPSFPITLEAVRECLQDVFDLPGLVELQRAIASRRVRVVTVDTTTPSPFARSLLFGYVAQFLYEGDSPLAERRAAALALDPALLAELLGGESASLADLLDPASVTLTEAQLQRLDPERRCSDVEDVADLLRRLGPLSEDDIAARVADDLREQVPAWIATLRDTRRIIPVRVAGQDAWAGIDDAARLRDALGAALPVGLPEPVLAPMPDPLGDLLVRYARTHGPFTAEEAAAWWGLGVAVVASGLRSAVADGRLVQGELRPPGVTPTRRAGAPAPDAPADGPVVQFCDPEVLRVLRRRSLATLRGQVEPVPPETLARFVPAWQGVGAGLRGVDGVLRAVEQLAGAPVPASALETLVLPARVPDYAPHLLDELLASGEVLWQGGGQIAGGDGWVSLHVAATADITLAPPEDGATPSATDTTGADVADAGSPDAALLRLLQAGGAWTFAEIAQGLGVPADDALAESLWRHVWAGRVTGEGLAALRARVAGSSTHRSRTRATARTRRPGRYGGLGRLGGAGLRTGLGGPAGQTGTGSTPAPAAARLVPTPPHVAGRWSLVPEVDPDPTVRAYARAEVLLERYGVVTRGSVVAADVPGGFAGVYRVLAAAEEAGKVRRGYLVDGLGAAQFATTGAVDRLRALAPGPDGYDDTPTPGTAPAPAVVLASTDPANPYGAALAWPDAAGDEPGGHPDPAEDVPGSGTDGPGGVNGGTGTGARDGSGGTGRGHRPSRRPGAMVVLDGSGIVLFCERGGRTVLSYTADPARLSGAAQSLAAAVHGGSLRALTVEKVDGEAVLGSGHPLAQALADAGFHTTPRGLRLRR